MSAVNDPPPPCSNRYQQATGVTHELNATNSARSPMRHLVAVAGVAIPNIGRYILNWSSTQYGVLQAALCLSEPAAAAKSQGRTHLSGGEASAMDPAKCLEILGNRGTCSGLHGTHHHGHAAGVLSPQATTTFLFGWQDCQLFVLRRRLP